LHHDLIGPFAQFVRQLFVFLFESFVYPSEVKEHSKQQKNISKDEKPGKFITEHRSFGGPGITEYDQIQGICAGHYELVLVGILMNCNDPGPVAGPGTGSLLKI